MNLREHENSDSMKVWLSESEIDAMLASVTDTKRRIALGLGVRCGLRSKEWLDVKPEHVVDTDASTMLRVWDGKGSKYRETPIPTSLATRIRTVGDIGDGPSEPVLDVTTTRALRGWINDVGKDMAESTGDPGWLELSTHDLRRTWATTLADHDVDALVALSWGGWSDLDTFLNHYKGPYSPAAMQENREKVDWLG